MRSLLVTKFVPFPADSGGKLRSAAMLELLREFGEVELVAFDDGRFQRSAVPPGIEVHAVPYRPSAARLAVGLSHMRCGSGGRFWDHRIARLIEEVGRGGGYDLVQVEYGALARYVDHADAGAFAILDMHNVESSLIGSYSRVRRGPVRLAASGEARALERLERWALERFDLTVVVTERDAGRLPPAGRVVVCANGWTPGAPLPHVTEPVGIFVALLGWAPNTDAALWLGREIWPAVVERVPGAKLLIVGRDPPSDVSRLASPTIEVVASPPDVRPYLARAAVAVAPLRAAGGSRLKILEALDAGRPVVATPVGAEGLEALGGRGVTVAGDAAEFAETVAELLLDPAAARASGLAGHELVAAEFSWGRTLGRLRRQLAAL